MYRVVKFNDGAYLMFGSGNETSCSCQSRSGCRKYRGSEDGRKAFTDAKRWGGKVYLVTTRAERREAADDIKQLMSMTLGHLQRMALRRARAALLKHAAKR